MSGGGLGGQKHAARCSDLPREICTTCSFSPKLNNFRRAPAQRKRQMSRREKISKKSSCEILSSFSFIKSATDKLFGSVLLKKKF